MSKSTKKSPTILVHYYFSVLTDNYLSAGFLALVAYDQLRHKRDGWWKILKSISHLDWPPQDDDDDLMIWWRYDYDLMIWWWYDYDTLILDCSPRIGLLNIWRLSSFGFIPILSILCSITLLGPGHAQVTWCGWIWVIKIRWTISNTPGRFLIGISECSQNIWIVICGCSQNMSHIGSIGILRPSGN